MPQICRTRRCKWSVGFARCYLLCWQIAPGMPALSNAETHGSTGAVFVMTNAASGNEIIAYGRNADGSLEQGRRFSTGGRGSGGITDPLASQGSLTLTEDRSFLLAVNAGSGSISVFRVHGDRLSLVDRVPCGGAEPVAVAQHGNLVYVLNAGGTSNVVGFRLSEMEESRRYATFHASSLPAATPDRDLCRLAPTASFSS